MSILQHFEKFLTTKHIIPKNRISFYLGWVTQCLAFLDKAETDDISPEDMDRFLHHLGNFRKEWQVQQTKEAIDLFGYFKSNHLFRNPLADISADDQWKKDLPASRRPSPFWCMAETPSSEEATDMSSHGRCFMKWNVEM